MTEQKAIEAIANDIQDGIYGWTQKCGTEWQKWTYSLNQARKIYEGDLIIDVFFKKSPSFNSMLSLVMEIT